MAEQPQKKQPGIETTIRAAERLVKKRNEREPLTWKQLAAVMTAFSLVGGALFFLHQKVFTPQIMEECRKQWRGELEKRMEMHRESVHPGSVTRTEFDRLERSINGQLDKLETTVEKRFDRIDGKIDALK